MKGIYLSAFAVLGISLGVPVQGAEFSLFGDTVFTKSKEHQQFNLGSLDLSIEQSISDSSKVTTEFLIQYDPEERHYGVDVERLSISRTFATNYKVFMGKFVDGLGLWAQTFHHGSLGQDTITAPFFLETEERHVGIISGHFTGLGVSGKLGDFGFQAVLANPVGIDSRQSDHHGFELTELDRGAPGTEFTQLLRLSYAPSWRSEVGIVMEARSVIELDQEKFEDPAYTIDCTDGAPPIPDNSGVPLGEALFKQNRVGLDYFFNGDKFYSYLEFYRVTVEDHPDLQGHCLDSLTHEENPNGSFSASSGSYTADVYYAQVGYRITPEWAVTVRHEALDIEEDATFFEITDWESQTRNVFGINYRFDASNALRFEASKQTLTHVEEGHEEADETIYRIQWFFLLL